MNVTGAISGILGLKPIRSVILRTPVALLWGLITFTVGFYQLANLSLRFTSRIIRGETPTDAITGLSSQRDEDER